MNKILETFGALTNADASRSDVLRPLVYIVGVLMVGTVGLSIYAKESIAIYIMLALLTAGVCLYLYAFIKCLHSNPDELRSERYHLRKMEIEHGFFGDDKTGIIDNSTTQLVDNTAIEVEK